MKKSHSTTFAKDSPIRISTREIDDALRQIEHAYTDGRIDDRELEKRTTVAISAKTEGELAALLEDLTRIEDAMATPAPVPRQYLRRLQTSAHAIFSGMEQSGNFILPKVYQVAAIFGGCKIDLTHAHLECPNSTIQVSAVFGGVEIIVPKGVRIEVQSTPIFGGITNKSSNDNLPHDAPTIHIHAEAIFGGITIKAEK